MAADYWQERFAGKSVALDMTMTYILVAFATVLLNNVFMTLVPYRIRVTAGTANKFFAQLIPDQLITIIYIFRFQATSCPSRP